MFASFSYLFAQAAGANNAAGAEAAEGIGGGLKLLIFVAIIALSYALGRFFSARLRMPDSSWRISLVLFALLASALIVATGTVKLGIDLAGGAIFVYEYEPKEGQDFQIDRLIAAVRERIDPAGVQQITIRPFGQNQIEIIVPEIPAAEIEQLQNKIENLGELEFLITANQRDHQPIIQIATREGAPRQIIRDGRLLASWIPVQNKPDTIESMSRGEYITRTGDNGRLEVLVVHPTSPAQQVTGTNLLRVAPEIDGQGRPSLSFHFDSEGGRAFANLTRANQPTGLESGTPFYRHLAVVLNGEIASAPTINAVISTDGVIEGNFSVQERDELIAVLNAGALPAELTPTRARFVDATLGEDMVRRGEFSIAASLVAVLLFVLVYYRFAGIVACLALLANLLLILALMISVKAAFTLAGLAGLVLTVGMAIDANVLIFERIREELERGAALRMAIRNGFSRATTTIVDSNLTTLITAVVLYVIGTDELRGFAIILILGILMSMFTAIFCSRLVFDIAEKRRWISTLRMMNLVRNANYDFMGKRAICVTASLILIGIGLVAVVARGRSILGIDFTGGTSAEVLFRQDAPIDITKFRNAIDGRDGWNDRIAAATRSDILEVVGPEVDRRVRAYLEDAEVLPRSIIYATVQAERDGTELNVDLNLPEPKPIDQFTDEEFEAYKQAALLPDTAISEITQIDESDPRKHFYMNTSNADGNVVEAILTRLFLGQLESNSIVSIEPAGGDVEPAPQTSLRIRPRDHGPAMLIAAADDQVLPVLLAQNTAAPANAQGAGANEAQPANQGTADEAAPAFDPRQETLEFTLKFAELISHDDVVKLLQNSALPQGTTVTASNPEYVPGSTSVFDTWTVSIPASETEARAAIAQANETLQSQPYFPSVDNIQGSVAARTAGQAIAAVVASLLGIVIYIWIRFQRVSYGLAAAIALVHDVLLVLGAVAISAYLVAIPFIDPFKISLDMVAAFLTIIGYSLNDTIVIFDRIREVKGKSPRITLGMINRSVNQTLSRTLLTSGTTLLVTVILFFFAGQAIHGFAFALCVGVIVGTYSSIFIASPLLAWFAKAGMDQEATAATPAQPQPSRV